jgi:hypothetical protein
MRKSLWIVPILLLFAAIGAPGAHADDIVQVTISNLTFNGNNVCGSSGTASCTQTLSESYQWDNTTNTSVSGSFSLSTAGGLGTSFSLYSGPRLAGAPFSVFAGVVNPATDIMRVFLGDNTLSPLGTGTYTLIPTTSFYPGTPGTFAADIFCGSATCEADFPTTSTVFVFATAGTVTVSTVPEPRTPSLILIGIGLVLVMRKRIARGLPQAS